MGHWIKIIGTCSIISCHTKRYVHITELSTQSIVLARKVSVPAGGPFIVLFLASGPAAGSIVSFQVIIVCELFSCSLIVFQHPLLVSTLGAFVSYLVLNFHRNTTEPSPKHPTPPLAVARLNCSHRCCCCG